MRVVFFILGVLAFLGGAGVLLWAQSAIHEIEAFMLFLISAVFLVSVSIMETLGIANRNLARIEDHLRTGIKDLRTGFKALDAKLIAIVRLIESKQSPPPPNEDVPGKPAALVEPNAPAVIQGTCKLCGGGLEFDSTRLGETIFCPHCGQETSLEKNL